MAERLLQYTTQRKSSRKASSCTAHMVNAVAGGKADGETAAKKVVLVGTYKAGQLERWPGLYNYPLNASDTVDAEAAKRVNEIWLFNGAKDGRYFEAKFVGTFTRGELVRGWKYPAKGAAHGEKYLLYRIQTAYAPVNTSDALATEVERVIVRAADFAKRSPKIAREIKAYLESPDRSDLGLAHRLPPILLRLPRETLCVCEPGVQMDFMDILDRSVGVSIPFPVREKTTFTFIDLFAGVGGIRMGFQEAGGKCVFSSEWNQDAAMTYRENFGEQPRGDITKISADEIPCFDVLLAGFPCQPFSISGKMRGFSDTRGTLFFEVCRIIDAKKPKVVFLENVKHLVHHDKGKTLSVILQKLRDFGYHVSWRVLNGSDFGVPQNRERIIIVGSKSGVFDFDQVKTVPKCILADFLDKGGSFEFLQPNEYTLIENPKRQEDSGLVFAGYRNKSIRKVGVRPNTLHLSRVHKQPNRIYSVDGVHPTLPSQESSGRYFILLRDRTVRKLTLPECWRIMGFPENFRKISSIGEQYRQLGNSVCVPMIRMVAFEVVRQLLKGEPK